ncbi:nucleotidyltransferase [Planococcus maritimus]|uniref:nucleotidyltransferase domain-containing protein n=1 Tax=Planococcus maritimus TaxID=192421 RepID=UPI00080EF836|nr:nucleotidyltransferase domain-containing protein [Planococcus maritimus]ANU16284.1 nucleotidyltransferase [Planococcus maritimus]
MRRRWEPMHTAKVFVETNFRHCRGALLAGSVVRGQETATSDLDIVVFDETLMSSYRESIMFYGWPVEVFVYNLRSYKEFFEKDRKAAKPSMPRMVSEGIILKDSGIMESIQQEAKALLEAGPEAWSADTIRTKRYFITDVLDDLRGSDDRKERLFCVNTLSDLVSEFILRTEQKWIGSSKWVIRSLEAHDHELAVRFVEAFEHFYRTDETAYIIAFVESVLEPYGGRLFDGFSIGKAEAKRDTEKF